MRRRRQPKPRLTVLVPSEQTAEVRGTGGFRVLERLKVPKMWQKLPPSGGPPCWTIPARHAVDVIAMAEHLGGQARIDRQQVLL